MLAGFDVKKSEIHGMSQRGGSVVSHVRFGREVFSPIVPEGEGDILFGFELLETYRYLSLLRPGATVVVNDYRIPPPSVLLGQETYPDDLPEHIRGQLSRFPPGRRAEAGAGGRQSAGGQYGAARSGVKASANRRGGLAAGLGRWCRTRPWR